MLVSTKRIVLRAMLKAINVGGTTGTPSRPIKDGRFYFLYVIASLR